MAAAGLWTTPTDLARYAIEIQRSLHGDANNVLSVAMAEQMLCAGQGQWGLGLTIGGTPENPFFAHGGINAGFEGVLVAYRQSGDGAVIMTNAQGGQMLANEILRGITSHYAWPDFRPILRTSVRVDRSILSTYTGFYQLTPTLSITISLENGQLMSQATHQRKIPLLPESRSKFFTKDVDAQLEFFPTEAGRFPTRFFTRMARTCAAREGLSPSHRQLLFQ